MAQLLKTNQIDVYGTLVEVKRCEKIVDKNGKNAVSTRVIVKVVEGDVEHLHEFSSYVNEKTKAGAENKMFSSHANIANMLNKRIYLSGTIGETRFWTEQDGQGEMKGGITLNYSYVREAKSTENDGATFVFGGCVAGPLVELKDKENNVTGYKLPFIQASYNEENMIRVSFNVENNDKLVGIINTHYVKGTTVEITGKLHNITVTEEMEAPETLFGDAVPRSRTRTDKKVLLLSGSNPVEGENAYTPEKIAVMLKAYEETGVAIQAKAKEKADTSKTTASTPANDLSKFAL